jgi:putative ABC transport system ATP-binding protein
MALIEINDVTKRYHKGDETITPLDAVTLHIHQGDFVSLMGASGTGKSTLLNLIASIDKPDSGSITIGEQRVDQMGKAELADMRLHNIGFVFQAYNLIPVLTALENVEFVMQVQGRTVSQRRPEALAILEEVGLKGMEDRLPSQLSGGQQQRVAVARAIVSKPTLVLADEPTANLDSKTSAQLMDLFVELNERRAITFVIATHDTRVMAYCKRLIKMQDGRIVADVLQQRAPAVAE